MARPSLYDSSTPPKPRLYRSGCADISAGHWREQRDFQRRSCFAAQPVSISASRPPDVGGRPSHQRTQSGTGYRDFLDWRQQNTVFTDMAIIPWARTFTWTGQGEPQRIVGAESPENFLRVLGVQPAFGRFISPEEDTPGADPVAVLSYEAWQRRFAGKADVLGRIMMLNGEPYTIIGVMPKEFAFPGIRDVRFFRRSAGEPFERPLSTSVWRSGAAEAGSYAPTGAVQYDGDRAATRTGISRDQTGWGIAVLPLAQMIAGDVVKPTGVLFAAVFSVLLLACANVAGLMLARASGRAKEIAIRVALGAGRMRLARQMLTESVLLAVAGGGLGLLFARWLINILRAAAPEDLALDSVLRINSSVLLFTLAVSLLTGLLFGLAPAWYGIRTDVNSTIKSSSSALAGAHSRRRAISSLVVGEVALSLLLLVGAGLLAKDLFVLLHLDLGIRTEHVLTFVISLPHAKYPSAQRTAGFYDELFSRLKAAPGVVDVAGVMTLPMTGGYTGGAVEIEGRPKPSDWMDTESEYNICTPGYFGTMGIPLLRGRDFEQHDATNALPVAVVNDTFARRYFPGEDAIGHRYTDTYDHKLRTIIGVVGSFRHQQPMQGPVPMVYGPYAQSPSGWRRIVVRTTGDPAALGALVRGTVRALDRDLPVLKLQTMKQVVSDSVSEQRLVASFITGFAVFALALAAIGIYSIIAYSVSQRMHEMGLRLALGASREDILRVILRGGALLVIEGVAVGIPLAFILSRGMKSLLYGISPRDLTIFGGVPLVLLLAALAASYLPARRAAKVEPMEALRYE